MFSAWKKEDSPPSRVKPVPMIILLRAAELAAARNSARDQATIDCIWMAFYFLIRPGEYANASGEAKHPFRLEDAECKIGHDHIFNVHLASVAQLLAATFISLTFTDQKNGIKGEQPFACPVRAITRRIIHLNLHNAPLNTLLHVYYDDSGRRRSILATMITSLLRAAALSIPGHTCVDPSNIAARSLHASGAMALLLGGMDPDKIRIVGRWKSDTMFRYLHAHTLPLIQENSRIMFHGGHYSLVTRHDWTV